MLEAAAGRVATASMLQNTSRGNEAAGLSIRSLRSLSAFDRVRAVVDSGSTAPVDAALASPRPSPHLARWGIGAQDDDGIAIARGRVSGAPVLIAAQDERFLGGSVGANHADALAALFGHAKTERPFAVVLLLASGGVRLHEANPAELGLARALTALQEARAAGVRVLAAGVGDVFGGASVLACAADRLGLMPQTRFGLSGPRVIEATRGRRELDASDGNAVAALFGAAARTAAGHAEALADDARAVRAWIAEASTDDATFTDRVDAMQARLGTRIAAQIAVAALRSPPGARRAQSPPLPGATPIDREACLWRAGRMIVARAPGADTFGPVEAHALDAALLTEFSVATEPGRTLLIMEDSAGHEVSRAAEMLGASQYMAQHTAVLALLRARGVRMIGLLTGTGHSAAFFANALQAQTLYALPEARVMAMEPAAIARVTGLAESELAQMAENDPLLGQPIRCFGQWGGIAAIVPHATAIAERGAAT